MISPTKPKKKYSNGKDTQSPTNSFMNDVSFAITLSHIYRLSYKLQVKLKIFYK